jgi:hypothetical protein
LNPQSSARLLLGSRGNAEVSAEIKEIILDAPEQVGLWQFRRGDQEQTQHRIEFIDRSIGDDARVILADAGPVPQAGLSRVAGARVDA